MIDRIPAHDLVKKAEQEVHVGVRADEDLRPHLLGGFGAPRVHEEDLAAPPFDGPEASNRVRQLHEARPGHGRIRSDHDQALGAVDVGKRLDEREPVHPLGGRELVVAILRPGLEQVARTQPLQKRRREDWRQQAERDRIAEIRRNRIAAVVLNQLPHLRADLVERLLPTDLLEATSDAFQGNAEPVR